MCIKIKKHYNLQLSSGTPREL